MAEVLSFAGKPERFAHPEQEEFVTLRINGRGAVPRVIGQGKTPVPFTGYRARAGQFIYSRIDARNGAFAILPVELDGAVVSKDFPIFDIHEGSIDPPYLLHYLRSGVLQREIRAFSFGATNRQRVAEDYFLTLRIPLPSTTEQRRIAAILDQADALRVKNSQIQTNLDALRQSIFNVMFGHAVHSAAESLGALSPRIDNGTSPVCEARPALPDEWGILKLGAVTYGDFRASENKAYLKDVQSMRSNEVMPGDVLMTRKNTKELVGAVAVVHEDVRPRLLLPDLVFRLHLDREKVEPVYFQAFMMTARVRQAVRSLASGSAASMPNISKARLRSLQIELPPLGMQREFVRRVAHVSCQKALTQQVLTESDTLFASLQSRAFRGEL